MRAKLIQILEKHTEESADNLADQILSGIRCDKCKYWESPNEEWMQGLGECIRLRDPKRGSPIVGANGGYLFTCPPDFFCAYFESK